MDPQVNLSKYDSRFSRSNKLGRIVWNTVYWLLFRPFAGRLFRRWRLLVLRLFGARLHGTAHVYASVRVWAPWNLVMDRYACLGPRVDCYNQGRITIGADTIVSQKSYLCASTHDHTDQKFPLIVKPITIQDQAWIAADAFIGPGVTVGQGAVVGARSAVFGTVDAWTIVGGNPARFIKKREIR